LPAAQSEELKGPELLLDQDALVSAAPEVPPQKIFAAYASCGITVAARAAPAISAVRGRGFEPMRRAAAKSQAMDDGLRTQENFSSVTGVALS